jgi:hypothetical protein
VFTFLKMISSEIGSMRVRDRNKTVPLRHDTMFLKGLHDSLSLATFRSVPDSEMRTHKMLRDYIKETIGFRDDTLELMKKKVFGAIEKHPQCKKMSIMYRPFVLQSVQ